MKLDTSSNYLASKVITLICLLAITGSVSATDLIINGSFDTDISDWATADNGNGTISHDPVIGSGSLLAKSNTGANLVYTTDISQAASPINSADTVLLSFYWYKYVDRASAIRFNAQIDLLKPDLSSVTVWTNNSIPALNTSIDGTESEIDLSSYCDLNGSYTIHLITDAQGSGNTKFTQMNWDDIVLDVRGETNDYPPAVVTGATQVSTAPVFSQGTYTTVISAKFSDGDMPSASAFTCTFKLRQPDNIAELILVDALSDGSGGLSVADIGGGDFRASYTYDPDDTQTQGAYDLFFEVNDGVFTTTDDYSDNIDELEIIDKSPTNLVTNGFFVTDITGWNQSDNGNGVIGHDPAIGSGSLRAKSNEGTNLLYTTDISQSVGPITSTDTVFLSIYWYKAVQRAEAVRFVSQIDIARPDFTSVTVWADSTIPPFNTSLDGTVTELDISSEFDQDGTYQIHLISDAQGTGNTEYTQMTWDNVVLDIRSPQTNSAPTIVAGATEVNVTSLNRFSTDATGISAQFADSDNPGVGAFTATFKIKDATEVEYTLVDNESNGNGGLVITSLGGGDYRAEYAYDPGGTQPLGDYDLYFEVSDESQTAVDGYLNNPDELNIYQQTTPFLTAGATTVTVSPVNRNGSNATIISTDYADMDEPGVNAFTVTIKVRNPNNVDEDLLVHSLTHGNGGLTITDAGGGAYTAQYSWDPPIDQPLGLYDLYFEVTDGTDTAIDTYADNLDELAIEEIVPPTAPTVLSSATAVGLSPVNRLDTSSTIMTAIFHDDNIPSLTSFSITFKIREPDNSTELVLVPHLTHSNGGLSIGDNGNGEYIARFRYYPAATRPIGFYDLYFEVDDNTGTATAVDGYDNNIDELELIEIPPNVNPVIAAGALSVLPASIDRLGAYSATFTLPFSDSDQPDLSAFGITVKLLGPWGVDVITVADLLQDGQGGLAIVDNGGGSYTATIDWDPPDNTYLGYYDLYGEVNDGTGSGTDAYNNNLNELLLTNGGENIPPIVQSDATYATPAGVERIGSYLTTLNATFIDGDSPPVSQFRVTFKIRDTANVGEIVLADYAAHGENGVSISDLGGGIYSALAAWDPPDIQALGYYDLCFYVTDQADTSYDYFQNNIDELQIYDAISNNPPTLSVGNLSVLPSTITKLGSDHTMLKATFTDIDMPGYGSFKVTFKVRDLDATEHTIVNLASHEEQGVRIHHVSGGVYEASVLWDPVIGQATGSYDLFFYVEDARGGSIQDEYAANLDELTLISDPIFGDGYLLRRTNDAGTCGGISSACHNLLDHQSQNCLVCHTPHGTTNIYVVRDSIQTPSSGTREVIFKTLGIGDPYNGPDPTAGDPNSGVMADETDGVFTGVCEVCHTSADHHRNDGSQPPPNHHDAENCTGCHPHTEGFAVSGGGESSGGIACSCHSSILARMDSVATGYHHILANDEADYSPGAEGMYTTKNCLSCHVDHDIFREDLNPGVGQRAKNLRVSWDVDPVPGSGTVLSNSDYSSAGKGGICLSCHGDILICSGCHSAHSPPNRRDVLLSASSSFAHISISKASFDAATSAHNYNVPTTFSSDGSTFNANCVKCHNDVMTKSYQEPTHKFSVHGSDYENILDSTGVTGPADPLEEGFCFKCHSTTSNPYAGSNLDFYGVRSITNPNALGIETAFSRTYSHPTLDYRGRHNRADSALTLGDGNRHAECEDCHDTHYAQQGTHDGSTNLVSNVLLGTWGVEANSWESTFSYPDNRNVAIAPTAFTKVSPAAKEYQICLKCHSNYVNLPGGSRNIGQEINPNYPSTHGIVQPGDNAYCNTTTMNDPWGTYGVAYCSDCHRSDNPADPNGPHGSNLEHLLVATIVSDNSNGTPLCDVCHKASVYWTGSSSSSKFYKHPGTQGQHKRPQGCFACHMWDYSSTPGLGLNSIDWSGGNPPTGLIHVHGQNRQWVYNEQDGSAGSGQPVENFINGYIANLNHTTKRCWSETCKGHSNAAY